MSAENFICGYCYRAQALTDARAEKQFGRVNLEGGLRKYAFYVKSIICANSDCRKLTFSVELGEYTIAQTGLGLQEQAKNIFNSWQLLPSSTAMPLPDYIPAVLLADYAEACLIRELSPKASATLARRCLQGMIRDFCGISKHRLVDEIRELRKQVEAGVAPAGVQVDTLEAIDAVREVGNIGAHMESDISLIVDVDPGEAQALIALLEMLFADWYVQRHERQQRLMAVRKVATAKQAAKRSSPPTEA